jgi:hypothetical protein
LSISDDPILVDLDDKIDALTVQLSDVKKEQMTAQRKCKGELHFASEPHAADAKAE